MFKFNKLLMAATLIMAISTSHADVFEDWTSPQVSIGGEFGWPTTFNIWNYSKRWIFNNWDASCNEYAEGPTPTLHANIPTPLGNTYILKIQYWNSSTGWRWDYFMNNTWIAEHPANPETITKWDRHISLIALRDCRLQPSVTLQYHPMLLKGIGAQ